MAAIDPSAEPEGDEGAVPRATLKVIRQPLGDDYSDDESDIDIDGMDMEFGESDSDEDDEEDAAVAGGPSDPTKSKKAQREAAEKEIRKLIEEEGMDVDSKTNGVNGVNGTVKSTKAKGKMPASDEEEDESESEIEDDMEGEVEEFVICTLDPAKNYQQTLDLTLGEDERVWFKVSGTHSIFLTGNYVQPVQDQSEMFDPDSDEEDEYDLSPNEDELDGMSDGESVDELDDLDDPRIMEMEDEDEEAPALVKAESKKAASKKALPSKKRAAADSADEDGATTGAETLDAMMAKEADKAAPTTNGEQQLSKKQLKKLKKNNGEAATAPGMEKAEKKTSEAEAPSSAKSEKKVAFANELVQGPTPTKDAAGDKTADKSKPTLGTKTVQGITIDDRKLGAGQAAKNGDRVGLRYIGKLENGKVFDRNVKGKPFSFKLGSGEVIKGWEIGVRGMQAGGERRITIPPHLAYGSQKLPDIPPNSTLIFDIKLVDTGKK